MKKTFKICGFSLLALAGLAVAAGAVLLVVLQTDWFKNQVRLRIVAEAARATGGRVEIGRFSYDWRTLTADVAPLVIHGTEPASGPPFFQAKKVQVGLKIISALKKQVDVASLEVEAPRLFVTVAPDGSTNVPVPKATRSNKNPIEQMIDLKVGRFEIHQGFAEYNSQRVPLDVHGEHLRVSLAFDPAGPRYSGEVSSRRVVISSPRLLAAAGFDLDAKIELQKNGLRFSKMKLASGGAKVQGTGTLTGFSSPRIAFDFAASAPVQELKKLVRIPLEPSGGLALDGHVTLETAPFEYKLTGKLAGRDLALSQPGVALRGIVVTSPVEITPRKIDFPDLQLAALGGRFRGSARVLDLKRLVVNGAAQNLPLAEAGRLAGRNTGQLSALLSGSVSLDGSVTRAGLSGVTAQAQLMLTPGSGGVPLQGTVAVAYDQLHNRIDLGNSEIDIGSTHLEAFGTLGANVAVHALSRNLNDVLALLPLVGEAPPARIPVELNHGQARFDGAISGSLANPTISGRVHATHLKMQGRELDQLDAAVVVDRTLATAQALTIDQGKLHVEGQGRAGLSDWRYQPSNPISATLAVRGADIATLLAEAGEKAPVTGSLAATLRLDGSADSPIVSGRVNLQNVAAYGERFPSARGNVTYTDTSLELANADARNGAARITFSGAYNHPSRSWKDGSLRFQLAVTDVSLGQIQHVQDFRAGLGGRLDVKAEGAAKVVNGVVDLTSLNGQAALKNALVDGRSYGDVDLNASTRLPNVMLTATANIGGSQINASGEWRMEGDYQGQARVQIPRLTFSTLHELWPGPHEREELPFGGFIEGEATVSGPLNQPGAMKATVTLSTVQLTAGPGVQPPPGARPQDLVLHNAEPIQLAATRQSIDIRNASFTAKDTTLTASGRLALDSRNPWDLAVRGRINLAILEIFNPDLLATGASVINVSVRGAFTEPQVDGRLELQNASLFLRDIPNGVDQANGVILFDRNRATVESLNAVTGGGDVAFEKGSFVGFRGPALIYRLQASARNVRYRSEGDVSVTANATVTLVGTSENSVLSGNVSVVRVAIGTRTDIGSLLASTARPQAVPSTPNEYLRGVQLDIRVVTTRSLEVESSLTRNMQADANLRLRGTPDRPVLLGDITINSGQIEFFGNKYSINRGVINFYNPAKIEPIIDMDLETQVRGITVDITFAGPLDKLNFSYRSDPPLEANEIIALLAVGRAPSTTGSLAAAQTLGNTSYLATGSNLLLSQAITPASGRLQKFFGVNHIRIDPQLTDVTAVPEAHLTFEQDISSSVTLTYITNLAVANQQIVRVEWDLTRKWSVVALRDENGAFSVDLQYKKRFK